MSEPTPYCLIHLNPTPEKVFAWPARNADYQNRNIPISPAYCEISFLQEGSIREMRPEGEITFPQGSVRVLFCDRGNERRPGEAGAQEFIMSFCLNTPPKPLTVEEAADWINATHFAMLPECITNHAACEEIGNLIKACIKLHHSVDMVRSLHLRTHMYECLALLTEQAVLQARALLQQPVHTHSPFTVAARLYMDQNLTRRPSVKEIADYVGVCYDYLNRVFRKDMNMTMLEYANRTRIHAVEKYITVYGMTMEQAGELVGITDVKYLSRLFHRYTGTSATVYRRIYQTKQER